MQFDINRLRRSDQVIAVTGAVLFICLFLPFFGIDGYHASGHQSGFLAWGGLWFGFLAGGLGFFPALGVPWPAQSPVTKTVATLGASALATLLLVIRFLDKPGGGGANILGVHIELSRSWGLYVALIAVIVQIVFAVMAFRESGESLPTRSSFTRGPGQTGTTGGYTSPTTSGPTTTEGYQPPPTASWQTPPPPAE